MLDDLTRRLRGLAAAHDLIYPGLQTVQEPVNLAELLEVLLKAYATDTSASQNVRISAPDIMVSERAITSLAMIIYELATNSAKFGALSAQTGKLELYCRNSDDEIELVWKETGGPAPPASNQQPGFGSLLTDRVVKQVKGTIVRDWTENGLNVTLRMSEAQLGA
jgi:two-component sensor histidine kinase